MSISAAIITMIIISLLLLPDWRCALWIGLSIFSIELGVVGYMVHFGINVDVCSAGILIMCIGFSVDYSAHVSDDQLITLHNELLRTFLL